MSVTTTLVVGVGKLLVEIGALVLAIVVVAKLLRRVGVLSGNLVIATAVVVGIATLVLVAENLTGSGSVIAQAQQSTTGSEDGIDRCFVEQGASNQIPFLKWVRTQIPPHATYVISTTGTPDSWCIALTLLPRLPAFNGPAQWLISFGAVPPSMKALIDRHDPSVQVFLPGMAIQHLAG